MTMILIETHPGESDADLRSVIDSILQTLVPDKPRWWHPYELLGTQRQGKTVYREFRCAAGSVEIWLFKLAVESKVRAVLIPGHDADLRPTGCGDTTARRLAVILKGSNAKYKFTFGVGALATTAVMAELWKPILPFWLVVIVTVLPFAVFVFADPVDISLRYVRVAHVLASAWYVTTVIALSMALLNAPTPPRGWILFVLLWLAGMVPSLSILNQALRGRYLLSS
jgi:hypothetical protein